MEKEKIYKLVWKFLRDHDKLSMPTPQYYVAEKILEEVGLNDYILFLYDDWFGMINYEEISKEEVFLKCVTLDEEEDTILAIWDNPGVIYLYNSAIRFLKSICTNPDLLEKPENPDLTFKDLEEE